MGNRSRHAGGANRGRDTGSQDGFTLPELLVAMTMLLIASVGVMALLLVSVRQSDGQSDRIEVLDEARNGMVQMLTDIRSAADLQSVSSQVLDVLVYMPDDPGNPYHWIRYKCVGNDQGNSQGLGGTCSRQDKDIHTGPDCSDSGSGPGCTIILRRVTKQATDSFEEPCDNYDPASTEEKHFCVKDNRTVQLSVFVEVPNAENPIELRDAVTIRNCLNNQQVVTPCTT